MQNDSLLYRRIHSAGSNENARAGGVRLWQTRIKQLQPSSLS